MNAQMMSTEFSVWNLLHGEYQHWLLFAGVSLDRGHNLPFRELSVFFSEFVCFELLSLSVVTQTTLLSLCCAGKAEKPEDTKGEDLPDLYK